MSKKTVCYVFLAEGFEEVEALTPVDMLRRIGADVLTVAVGPERRVRGSHGIPVEADVLLDEADFKDAALLVAPGGMPGATNLAASPEVCSLFKAQADSGALVGAICAAPGVLLAPLGILRGRKATCYPGFETTFADGGAEYDGEARVVTDGNIITANGPSSALNFALALVGALYPEAVDTLSRQILLTR